jgi:hypothetical protein
VLVRRLGHGTALRPGYTWVIALILFGLGCVLPYVVGHVLFESRTRYRNPDELLWLYLTNPTVTIDDAIRPDGGQGAMTSGFVAVWAVAVTLLNAGWLGRQVAHFRPPKIS